MYFTVVPSKNHLPHQGRSTAFLVPDDWDDWFHFSTLYSLFVFDHEGQRHVVGDVKIGQFDMEKDQRRPDIPKEFDKFDDRFFSLGQDDSYYKNLNTIGPDVRQEILTGLRDVALDLDLFERALNERVTNISLLRSVLRNSVTGQLHRMANGGARLSKYKFTYTHLPASPLHPVDPLILGFSVEPESYPPTNIHVLIGRNGVGKTITLDNIAKAIIEGHGGTSNIGTFSVEWDDSATKHLFSSLVSVTFSAFDPFEPLSTPRDKSKGVQYEYVGLKYIGTDKKGKPRPPKTPDQLSRDFGSSVSVCRQGARVGRWRQALRLLEADPIFSDAEVAALASENLDYNEAKDASRKLFSRLSSGHKIVLLTITRLVETVQEKTLVLVDEPEAHLHPPLLSAFVRAISDLLIDRNGVALIATHSPVVLQEVPNSCVWKIRRTGRHVVADRPDIETFGENVGVLTSEVFGLEVTNSGFHKMLRDTIEEEESFEHVVMKFSRKLGGEARAIVRTLIETRKAKNEVDL